MNGISRSLAALVLVMALLAQTAPICCLMVYAAPVEDAHSAAGHHGPAHEPEGAFNRDASECVGTIRSFTGLRVQSQLLALEASALPSAGPVPVRVASFPVVQILQRVDHPQRISPPPYLPLRL